MGDGKVLPLYSKFFAFATNRTRSWNGIEQEITGRVQPKLAYEVTAVVRIFGANITNANIRATLWVQNPDIHERVQATDKDWVQLQGKFLLNGSPSRVIIFLEGPPPGTDILINSLAVKHAEKVSPPLRPFMKNEAFGVNIIENRNLDDGINGWFPLGNCYLSMEFGSPIELPPIARNSLGFQERLSGRYIRVTNRAETWMGPAQMISGKLKLYLTYQMSAWVRIGSGSTSPQTVNVVLSVDGNWINGGQVELTMKAGMRARFKLLKELTDKIRKRDLILKFSSSEAINVSGASVQVKQIQNSFPFGSCITSSSIDNEGLGNFNYKDADELLEFCKNHSLEIRAAATSSKTRLVTLLFVKLMLTSLRCTIGEQERADLLFQSLPDSYDQLIINLTNSNVTSLVFDDVAAAVLQERIIIVFSLVDREKFFDFALSNSRLPQQVEYAIQPWELYMSRENAHLVNAEGKINAAGKRYLALKKEWLSHARGYIDALGEFRFRGFYGTYNIDINSPTTKIDRTFVVDKGELSLAITIDL
ncbi:hypothetical protein F3Y22_tig00116997pilonHSYRG00864 [Hibiscus syriacus]|uniref:CBM-cenC domain-containing protein n=1 Tax=Hibiscus syriacus TaxID=106335 RepID=A0A6A2XSX0_HIBSY|nr:hypothetical protein F3Y22_tig00116997pilonHSYRG00864 [Hibiscus syriacus]